MCPQPQAQLSLSGTRCLSSRVMLAMHCPPQGPRRPPRTSLDQTPRPDHICMASGVRTVIEHPGCPGCRARRGGAVLSPPLSARSASIPPLVALGEADGTELPPPRGKGCFWPGVPPAVGTPYPRKGYSWLFYKYIYIFCSKVLLPHVRAGAPGIARIPKPGWSQGQCPGGSHPTLGVLLLH